jgi:hypothetical protein
MAAEEKYFTVSGKRRTPARWSGKKQTKTLVTYVGRDSVSHIDLRRRHFGLVAQIRGTPKESAGFPTDEQTHVSDDTMKRDYRDRDRINVHEDYEVRYWSKELGVTPEKLKQTVEKVGVMSSDVRKALGK